MFVLCLCLCQCLRAYVRVVIEPKENGVYIINGKNLRNATVMSLLQVAYCRGSNERTGALLPLKSN